MLVCKEFVPLWCAWNQRCTVSSPSLFPVMLCIHLLEHKILLPNFTKPEVLLILPLLPRLHVDSSISNPQAFFCNKGSPGCLLWRKWLCWSCAGPWQWCGEACCCSSWESLIKRWSWPCFLTALRQAEGYLCLSCNFLASVKPQNIILDGVWHSLNAAAS